MALLEYEWITGSTLVEPALIDQAIMMITQWDSVIENNEFAFWLNKARNQAFPLKEVYAGYNFSNKAAISKAAALWKKSGCPYELALAFFEENEDGKRKAISIVQELGATAVYEKMKLEMRTAGI
ncbi:MAG: hypothetical protein ABUT20_38860, partial [Bacteroidota bacterium]